MRVQSDHWAIILEFCEQYPQIITNKFTALGSRQELNELWKKLAIKLNSLGHGEKSVEGWKKTITDWKSKTKAKAGTIKTHISQTGGGTHCNLALTSYEERLLNIMGKTSYEGNPQNIERGIRKRKLFDAQHNGGSIGKPVALVPVHKTDHTYVQDTVEQRQTDMFVPPVANETEITTDEVIRPYFSNVLPHVHFSSVPSSTSTQFLTTSKTTDSDLTNLEISYLPEAAPKLHFPHIPPSSTITSSHFTPSKTKNGTDRTDIAPVHLTNQETTPCNSYSHSAIGNREKGSERRRIGNKKDGSEQLQRMHNELLFEIKKMNENIQSIAESLQMMAVSLRK